MKSRCLFCFHLFDIQIFGQTHSVLIVVLYHSGVVEIPTFQQFKNPLRLNCHHSFCQDCIRDKSCCPVCDYPIEGEAVSDILLSYLIETSYEVADVCANCDQVIFSCLHINKLVVKTHFKLG